MKQERVVQLIILGVVVFYTQYYHLTNLTYRIWDEARLATSAYEMAKSGNIMVPTFEDKPDMWNTKPPLMIWAQAILVRVHGLTELSVRLPSSFCATLTCLLIFGFVLYLTQSGWFSLFGAVALCTFNGYIGYHGVRNGEYDSMLTLFTTAYLISIFLYCQIDGPKRNWFLLLFFLNISLGILTKSVAALLFLPAVFVYLLFSGKMKDLFTNRYFYIGSGLSLLMVLGYYLLREHYNPGYLQAVYENELGGRFLKTNEEHNEPAFFYFTNFYLYRLRTWLWFFPLAAIFLFLNSGKRIKNAVWFLLLISATFLFIISSSKTKLLWYDMPLYPLIATLFSLGAFSLFSWVSNKLPPVNKSLISIFLCLSILGYPAYEMYNMIKWEGDYGTNFDNYSASYYLRDLARSGKDVHNYIYFYDDYCPQFTLYIKRLNDMGMNMTAVQFSGGDTFRDDSKVITNSHSTGQYIESKYEYEVYEEVRNIRVYLIKKAKA